MKVRIKTFYLAVLAIIAASASVHGTSLIVEFRTAPEERADFEEVSVYVLGRPLPPEIEARKKELEQQREAAIQSANIEEMQKFERIEADFLERHLALTYRSRERNFQAAFEELKPGSYHVWVMTGRYLDRKNRNRPGAFQAIRPVTLRSSGSIERIVVDFIPLLRSGDRAPDVEVTDLSSGEAVRLSEFGGNIVVLEFWASWCGPCQPLMEELQEYAEDVPTDVRLVTVSLDQRQQTAMEHLKKQGWTKTQNTWADGEFAGSAAQRFGVTSLPHVAVIDKEGRFVAAGRPVPSNRVQMRGVVEHEFSGRTTTTISIPLLIQELTESSDATRHD